MEDNTEKDIESICASLKIFTLDILHNRLQLIEDLYKDGIILDGLYIYIKDKLLIDIESIYTPKE